jgi:ribosomal protein L37AE/L43A
MSTFQIVLLGVIIGGYLIYLLVHWIMNWIKRLNLMEHRMRARMPKCPRCGYHIHESHLEGAYFTCKGCGANWFHLGSAKEPQYYSREETAEFAADLYKRLLAGEISTEEAEIEIAKHKEHEPPLMPEDY